MNLEIGMYVRTNYSRYKNDNIGIISEFYMKNQFWMKLKDNTKVLQLFDDVIKASFDIIDLIEVGDYIDGHEVVYKDDELIQVDSAGWLYYDGNLGMICHQRYEEPIKSIVTKEQFKSIEYVVDSND